MSEDAAAITEYTEEVKEELKEKGAEKVFSLGDIRLYECPLTYISEDTGELIRLCFLVENNGNLFYEGGWGNQPMWLVEAFDIFKGERARHVSNITVA